MLNCLNISSYSNIIVTRQSFFRCLQYQLLFLGAVPIFEFPRVLIDVSAIEELKSHYLDQNLCIGAGTTLADFMGICKKMVETRDDFSYLQTFYEHLDKVAHIPVRNVSFLSWYLSFSLSISQLFFYLSPPTGITIIYTDIIKLKSLFLWLNAVITGTTGSNWKKFSVLGSSCIAAGITSQYAELRRAKPRDTIRNRIINTIDTKC